MHTFTGSPQKAACQSEDIIGTFTQRRQADLHDIEPVVEVFPELTGAGHGLEVAVGGGDQAHIDLTALGGAHTADFAFLQDPEQASLGFRRQFADFIQE